MASRTIRPTESPAPAPFAYTVSAPDGFAPEAVFASWDGTGAGGDFLPCVSYYNADGVLLDRAFPTTGAVTAGDTADVGYRPFERGGGAAAVKLLPPPFVMAFTHAFTLPDSTPTTVDFHPLGGAEAYTNDIPTLSGYRTNGGAAFVDDLLWTGDNFTGQVHTAKNPFAFLNDRPGSYVVSVFVTLFVLAPGGQLLVKVTPPSTARIVQVSWQYVPLVNTGRLVHTLTFPLVIPAGTPGTVSDLQVDLFQDSGVAINGVGCGASAYRVSAV